MPRIKETLKKFAGSISVENMPNTSNTNAFIGDPDCPICHGIGFTRQHVPYGHAEFGKVVVCSCRQQQVSMAEHRHLVTMSNLSAFQNMTFETFNVRGRLGLADEQSNSLAYCLNQAQHFATI